MRLETLHSRPPCAADTADSSARAHKPHGVVHIIHARLLAHLLACLRPVLAVLAVRGLVRERAAAGCGVVFHPDRVHVVLDGS